LRFPPPFQAEADCWAVFPLRAVALARIISTAESAETAKFSS